MTTQQNVSDLLAHRDGEKLDPEIAAQIEADPVSRERLQQYRELKYRLNELPAVAPPAQTWEAIQQRTAVAQRSFMSSIQRFPLATAASVFFAAALGILLWNPANLAPAAGVRGAAGVAGVAGVAGNGIEIAAGQDYAALVNRSQRLELLLSRASRPVFRDAAQQAIKYRLADLDAELDRYAYGERQSPAARELLWRQRVELLESLAQARRLQAVAQAAVY